jgi:hypothetical protein
MAINVTVADASPLDSSTPDALLVFTFTNTAAFSYAANSSIYYYVFLTDSTPTTPLTQEVTFVVPETTQGTIAAGTPAPFELVNTLNLISPITATNGRICYKPQT